MFAGMTTNTLIAALAIAMSFAHAVAVIPSVLGQAPRRSASPPWSCGVLHSSSRGRSGSRLRRPGSCSPGSSATAFVFCALAWRPFAAATGTTELALVADVLKPWALRIVPMIDRSRSSVQRVIGLPSLPVAIAVGGAMGLLVVLFMRPLYIEFGPVRALYDRVMRWATGARP